MERSGGIRGQRWNDKTGKGESILAWGTCAYQLPVRVLSAYVGEAGKLLPWLPQQGKMGGSG